jgi:hypothetical protein
VALAALLQLRAGPAAFEHHHVPAAAHAHGHTHSHVHLGPHGHGHGHDHEAPAPSPGKPDDPAQPDGSYVPSAAPLAHRSESAQGLIAAPEPRGRARHPVSFSRAASPDTSLAPPRGPPA